jgi:hypothetical protein
VKVWPALPAPGELVRLPLPCPPQLIELSGYTGSARLIALWWSPFGDELMISDGAVTETGRWRGWLCFCGHPLARLFLEPYRLGDSQDQGDHRLLVDRYLGTLDVGLARDVEQLLATQPSELHALTADLLGREAEVLLLRLFDVHGEREQANSPQQLHAEMRAVWHREDDLLDQLTALLDDAQGRCAKHCRRCRARMPREAMVRIRGPRRRDDSVTPRRRPQVAAASPAMVLRSPRRPPATCRQPAAASPATCVVCRRAATCRLLATEVGDEAAAVRGVDVPGARRASRRRLVDVYGLGRIT